jgi:hypothetical protein
MLEMTNGSYASLKADYYEGKILQCSECEYITEEMFNKHFGSDNYNKYLPCLCKRCKHEVKMEELRGQN